MAAFKEANQVRLVLKMKLSNYAWYRSSDTFPANDGWGVTITVAEINNKIRKMIPPVVDDVSVRTEVE